MIALLAATGLGWSSCGKVGDATVTAPDDTGGAPIDTITEMSGEIVEVTVECVGEELLDVTVLVEGDWWVLPAFIYLDIVETGIGDPPRLKKLPEIHSIQQFGTFQEWTFYSRAIEVDPALSYIPGFRSAVSCAEPDEKVNNRLAHGYGVTYVLRVYDVVVDNADTEAELLDCLVFGADAVDLTQRTSYVAPGVWRPDEITEQNCHIFGN